MKRFPKKRIAITGAGSGLGRALALEFAGKGWNIVVTDMNNEKAEETLHLVIDRGGQGFAATCDVRKIKHLENLADSVNSKWDGLDIIVNNAGVAAGGFMEQIPMDDWDWIMDINLMGVVRGCKVFIPLFKRQGFGHIVNTASAASFVSPPEESVYNVSKSAVMGLSETLRMELSMSNVGVTVIAPGFFKTNLLETIRTTHARQMKIAVNAMEKAKFTAEDVAKATYNAVEKDRFYVILGMAERNAWRFKRLFPNTFMRLIARSYRSGKIDDYFELEDEYKLERIKG